MVMLMRFSSWWWVLRDGSTLEEARQPGRDVPVGAGDGQAAVAEAGQVPSQLGVVLARDIEQDIEAGQGRGGRARVGPGVVDAVRQEDDPAGRCCGRPPARGRPLIGGRRRWSGRGRGCAACPRAAGADRGAGRGGPARRRRTRRRSPPDHRRLAHRRAHRRWPPRWRSAPRASSRTRRRAGPPPAGYGSARARRCPHPWAGDARPVRPGSRRDRSRPNHRGSAG